MKVDYVKYHAIEIEIKPDGHVHMTGPVSCIASGAFSEELWQHLR